MEHATVLETGVAEGQKHIIGFESSHALSVGKSRRKSDERTGIALLFQSFDFHRITQSQNGRDWMGGHLVQPPCSSRDT